MPNAIPVLALSWLPCQTLSSRDLQSLWKAQFYAMAKRREQYRMGLNWMISDMLQAASDSQLPEKKRSIGCGGWEDMSKRKEISTKKKKWNLSWALKEEKIWRNGEGIPSFGNSMNKGIETGILKASLGNSKLKNIWMIDSIFHF